MSADVEKALDRALKYILETYREHVRTSMPNDTVLMLSRFCRGITQSLDSPEGEETRRFMVAARPQGMSEDEADFQYALAFFAILLVQYDPEVYRRLRKVFLTSHPDGTGRIPPRPAPADLRLTALRLRAQVADCVPTIEPLIARGEYDRAEGFLKEAERAARVRQERADLEAEASALGVPFPADEASDRIRLRLAKARRVQRARQEDERRQAEAMRLRDLERERRRQELARLSGLWERTPVHKRPSEAALAQLTTLVDAAKPRDFRKACHVFERQLS